MDNQNSFANWLQLTFLESSVLLQISLRRIIKRLRYFRLISENTSAELLEQYASERQVSSLEWTSFTNYIRQLNVTFEKFIEVLKDCGYSNQCQNVMNRQNQTNIVDIRNRELLHEQKLSEFYARMKSLIDDNAFVGGSQVYLNDEIQRLHNNIALCGDNASKKEFLVNKQVLCFYLLTHTYSDIDFRMAIMDNMQDCITRHGTDRTVFDIVIHACRALNYAAIRSPRLAGKHKSIVHSVYLNSFSPFLSMLTSTAFLYMAANQDSATEHEYRQCLQSISDYSENEDEFRVFTVITKLTHAHKLLGINWNFRVKDIKEISVENILQARDILSQLEPPREDRRRLWYFMCKGRLFELSDLEQAKMNVRKALEYAIDHRDACVIREYLDFLSS